MAVAFADTHCFWCDLHCGPRFARCRDCRERLCSDCVELWKGGTFCYPCLELLLGPPSDWEETQAEEEEDEDEGRRVAETQVDEEEGEETQRAGEEAGGSAVAGIQVDEEETQLGLTFGATQVVEVETQGSLWPLWRQSEHWGRQPPSQADEGEGGAPAGALTLWLFDEDRPPCAHAPVTPGAFR